MEMDMKVSYLKTLQGRSLLINLLIEMVASCKWLSIIQRREALRTSPTTGGKANIVTGFLWQTLYISGAIKTPIYPDVLSCLHAWHNKNILVAIYSSGSVSAQKLFFQHTDTPEVDLSDLIADHFDTSNAGPKTEAQSYKSIADALKVDSEGILFLSDIVKEVAAAQEAGMKSVIVVREGNAPLSDVEKREYIKIRSFDELDLDTL